MHISNYWQAFEDGFVSTADIFGHLRDGVRQYNSGNPPESMGFMADKYSLRYFQRDLSGVRELATITPMNRTLGENVCKAIGDIAGVAGIVCSFFSIPSLLISEISDVDAKIENRRRGYRLPPTGISIANNLRKF